MSRADRARALHVGPALCEWLTDYAGKAGFTTVLGLATSTNKVSIRMMERLGYERGGAIARIGYKHGELIDLEGYQRFYDDNIERCLQEGKP